MKKATTGAYTVIQRFSGSLALSIHSHSLLLDGVFGPGGAEPTPVFHPLEVMEADVLAVVRSTELAVWCLRGLPSSRQAARRRPRRKEPMCATSGAFDLHARVRVQAEHRGEFERLARYLLRPAIAIDRLRLLPGGMVAYDLRSPWVDGTTGFLRPSGYDVRH